MSVLVAIAAGLAGCSAPAIAVNGRGNGALELAATAQRGSLFGDRFFAGQGVSPARQTSSSQGANHQVPAAQYSEERLLAIAKLFMAQGRTQQAMRIYQQLGRSPETVQAGISTPQLASQMKSAGQAAGNRPGPSVTVSAPAQPEAAAAPARTLATTKIVATAQGRPQDGALQQAADDTRAVSTPVHGKHAGLASRGSLTPLTPLATQVSHKTLNAPAPGAADSPGWMAFQGSSAAKHGVATSVAVAANENTRSWSTFVARGSANSEDRSRDIDFPERRFQMPAAQDLEPDLRASSVHVFPGRFFEPVIRNERRSMNSGGNVPAEKSALGPCPAIQEQHEQRAAHRQQEGANAPSEREVEDRSYPNDGGLGLLIIPNGVGVAGKMSRVRQRIQSELAGPSKDSTIPANDLSNPARVLLSGPYREMHSLKVLETVNLLTDPDPQQRALGAQRLGQAGSEARTVLPVLRDRLTKEPETSVKFRIAEAIVRIVPDDAAAIAELTRMLSDPVDWRLRQRAAAGLAAAAQGSNAEVVSKLTDAMNDGHPRVRAMAALSLGTFGPKATGALPRLQFAIQTDIPRVQEAAEAAAACISADPEAKAAEGDADESSADQEPGHENESHRAGELRTGAEDKSHADAGEDDGDPFSGTVFDFDLPAEDALNAVSH